MLWCSMPEEEEKKILMLLFKDRWLEEGEERGLLVLE